MPLGASSATSSKNQKGINRKKRIRAADAKEVGVGNPAEETYCYPNRLNIMNRQGFVNSIYVLLHFRADASAMTRTGSTMRVGLKLKLA